MATAGVGEVAALGSAALWALASVVMGGQTAHTPAVVVSAMRGIAGALTIGVLGLLLYAGGQLHFPDGATALALIGSGIVGLAVGDTLYIRSLGMLGVGRTFPISMAVYPLLTFLLAAAVLGEHIHPAVVGGAVLIVAGIVLIVTGTHAPTGETSTEPAIDRRTARIGLTMVVVSAALWAAASVWLRSASEGVAPIAAQTLRTPIAAGLVTCLALGSGHRGAAWRLSRRVLGALLITGVLGTAAGSVLFVIAVQNAGAARSSLLSSTAPLFALPLAAVVLHERITRRVIVGTVLTIGGIWLVIGA